MLLTLNSLTGFFPCGYRVVVAQVTVGTSCNENIKFLMVYIDVKLEKMSESPDYNIEP